MSAAALFVAIAASATSAQRRVVVPSTSLYSTTLPTKLFSVSCVPGARLRNVQAGFIVEPQAVGFATAIAFRRSDFPSSPTTYPPLTVEIELGLSHTTRAPALISWRLSENRGLDYRVVIDRQTFQFPALPPQPGTYPFSYRYPFNRPFLLLPNRFAMWQMNRYRSSSCWTDPQPLGFDSASWTRDVSQAPVTQFGVPCGTHRFANWLRVNPLTVGNYSTAFMSSQSPGGSRSFALIYWGLRADRWGSFPLPIDLGPLGAPGCFVYISLDGLWPLELQFPGPFSGPVDAAVDVPHVSILQGIDVFFQGVRFDSDLNALDIATSNGVQARIGPHQVVNGSMLWSDLATQADLGWRQGISPIFELTLQ